MTMRALGLSFGGLARLRSRPLVGALTVLILGFALPCSPALADDVPPATPEELSASPGDGKVTLDWKDNSEQDLNGYDVYRDGQYLNWTWESDYVAAGLVNGQSHTYTVIAIDTSGNVSGHTDPVTTCSGFGTYAVGNWPPSCWKPYAASSPFNQPLPANPQPMSNSSAIVARMIGDISAQNYPANLWVRDDGMTGEPTYWSRPTDPEFTIRCTEPWGTCNVEGMKVRIPAGAKTERPTDQHLTVIDQATGREYNFWGVEQTTLPSAGGPLNVMWGSYASVTGVGNDGAATAASFTGLAGRLRVEELTAPDVGHALNIAIDCSNGQIVYPATGHGGQACSWLGKSNVDAPPMGARLQLNMTNAEIAALEQTDGTDVPAWRERIYRAMAKYGMFFGDTGTGGYFQIEHESGAQYTSVGRTDAWRSFVQSDGWPRDADNTGYVGFFRYDDVDWANRLRVIAPCVSQRTC